MAREHRTGNTRLTNEAIRAWLEDNDRRLDRIEPFIYTAIAGAAGMGVVVGLFAKQVAKVILGA